MSDDKKTEDVEGHWGTTYNANEAVDADLEPAEGETEEIKGGITTTGTDRTATM
jgi:hypothetical protein